MINRVTALFGGVVENSEVGFTKGGLNYNEQEADWRAEKPVLEGNSE